ncbi:IS3 family transposase [Nocardia acidivorans]|uniref:IS3 family transposase n=1 Tax=Nocardia acidivorans TaxID=404580 RepID=UPI000B306E39|nr:IS3 family transposase [Nocardia acidivorans]
MRSKAKYAAIAAMAEEGLSIRITCRVLGVSESGFYDWRSRPPSQRQVRHAWLTALIAEVHNRSRGAYGSRRVHAELWLGRGIVVGHGAVELLMRRAGIAGAIGRPAWKHAKPDQIATDHVNRDFTSDAPNRKWLNDITEHHTREGKVYYAVVLDGYSRRVVGWSIDSTPHAALVTQCARDGHRHPLSRDRNDHSFRPGHAVRLVGIHQARQGLWARSVDGQCRRLL